MNILTNPNEKELNKVVTELGEGKIVVYPTDTLYGIATNIYNIDSVKKIYEIKQRPLNKAISVSVHDIKQLKTVAKTNKAIDNIIEQLLPGSYTLLLKKQEEVPSILTSNTDIVGVRIPDNYISYILTSKFPITTTSANLSNKITPNNIPEVRKQLKDNIDTYIDIGEINNNHSTILDLTKEYPSIVRQGQCDEELLKKILKINLYQD